MRLIVGLGNPGNEYKKTRHNIGYDFLDYYLKKSNINEKWSKKFNGQVLQTVFNGEKVLFLKPETYMNLSGDSVIKAIDYYSIDVSDILIISDDLDLFLGNYKLKNSGTYGGHKGLKDIELKIGTKDYKRLKIGISNNKEIDTKDYVLGKLSKEEEEILNKTYSELKNVLDDYFFMSFEDLMSKYNHKNR